MTGAKRARRTTQVIPEWRRSWRLDTMRAAALLAALSLLQTDALPLLQALVPDSVWPWVTLGFAVAIALLRVRAQPTALGEPPASSPDASSDEGRKPW